MANEQQSSPSHESRTGRPSSESPLGAPSTTSRFSSEATGKGSDLTSTSTPSRESPPAGSPSSGEDHGALTRKGWSRFTLLVVVSLLILAADQITKFQAVKHLTTVFERTNATTLSEQVAAYFSESRLRPLATPPKHVFRSWWSHVYAENPGAAWSFAASWPDHIRLPFFHLATALAIALIAFYFAHLQRNQRLLRLALAMVMGGALGNLMDRLVRGYVIDFIDWHLNDPLWTNPRVHWPTFNIADVAITLGVVLIAVDSLWGWIQERRKGRSGRNLPHEA